MSGQRSNDSSLRIHKPPLEGEWLGADEPDPRKSRRERAEEWQRHQWKAERVHAAYMRESIKRSMANDDKMDMHDAISWLLGIGFYCIPVVFVVLLGWLERKAPGSGFVLVAACFILPLLYFICKCILVIARGLWNGER